MTMHMNSALTPDIPDELTFFYEATQRLCSSLMPEVSMAAFFEYISRFLPLTSFSLACTPPPFVDALSVAQMQPDGSFHCPFERVTISPKQEELGNLLGLNQPEKFLYHVIEKEDDPLFQYINMFAMGQIMLPLLFLRLVRENQAIGAACFGGNGPFSKEHIRLMVGLEAPLCMALSNILHYHELQQLKDEILQDNQRLRQELKGLTQVDVIGSGRGLAKVMQRVRQAAPVDVPILITGETGTGKEVIARAVHELSSRNAKTFVAINCGAIPASLIDSELFGHAKGAFTGATSHHKGYFERAEGGTLFLDEIGELPLESQARLLRVLETHEVEKVGGTVPLRVDIRLLAATNRNLREMISAGSFREDLYYRLNVISINLPPLRDRKEDIPLLIQHLILRSAARFGVLPPPLAHGEMERLLAYPWPGNVRELQNVLEEALVCTPAGTPLRVRLEAERPMAASEIYSDGSLDDTMRVYMEKLLTRTGGRISGPKGAALIAGVNASTFRFKCKKLGIPLGPGMR